MLWSSTSLLVRATSATAVLRRTESWAPAARIVAISRIFPASAVAAPTSSVCSAARLVRSWQVADISWVEALISSVEAEISVAIAAASSAAARIAPTSRRSAATIECTAESSSPTSAESARCVATVTDRSPPATRLAIAPAAFTGPVTRRSSHTARSPRKTMVARSAAPAPIRIVRSVRSAGA